jgi:hypothetical protein
VRQSWYLFDLSIVLQFSGVLWRRRVFPGVRYKFRVFDPADPRASYDTFVNEGGLTSTADFNCWPILPRSDDPRTEKLLNLLVCLAPIILQSQAFIFLAGKWREGGFGDRNAVSTAAFFPFFQW